MFLGSCHRVRTWNPNRRWARRFNLLGTYFHAFPVDNGTYLFHSVSSVPQGVPEMLAWSCGWVHYFNGQSGIALGFGGCMRPIGLCDLLPHHHVKPRTGLVAEHKAGVVVIAVGVDEERATEVHSIELIITCRTSRTKLRFCDQNLL